MKNLARIFFLVITLNLLSLAGFSQTELILEVQNFSTNVWEAHDKTGLCPGAIRNYRIKNYRPDCHKVTMEGTHGASPIVNADGTFQTAWADAVATSKVIIENVLGTQTACGNAAPNKTFDILVLSIAGVIPTITQVSPSNSLDVGFAWNATFSAAIAWPSGTLGTSEDASTYAFSAYTWAVAPASWTTTPSTTSTIMTTTDLSTDGTIRVSASNPACTDAVPSATATRTVTRNMPSPCRSTLPTIKGDIRDYELCGDPIVNSFTCAPLPTNFTPPPGGITRTWTLDPPDGWTKLGQAGNTVEYLTDGQKARKLTVNVNGYGRTNSCSTNIPLLLANPDTKLVGPDKLCGSDVFKLTIPPGSGINTTWQVKSKILGQPAPTTPSSGSGSVANLTPSGSGEAEITFTLEGCGKTETYKKGFFSGTPYIQPNKTNGVPLNTVTYVCVDGSDVSGWMNVKLFGDNDGCVDSYTISGSTAHVLSCNEIDWVWQSNPNLNPPYNPVHIVVQSSNACGSSNANYTIIPKTWGCERNPWWWAISPNPSNDMAIAVLKKESLDGTVVDIQVSDVKVLDFNSTLIYSITPSSEQVSIDTRNLQNGWYFIRTVVDGQPIQDKFLVEHGN